MTTTAYTVQGMTCAHCVTSVSTEVGALPGVSDVQPGPGYRHDDGDH